MATSYSACQAVVAELLLRREAQLAVALGVKVEAGADMGLLC